MTRYAIIAALAIVTPIRRGLSYVEGHLAHAEYRIRHTTGALFIIAALAVDLTPGVLMLPGCATRQAGRTLAEQRHDCDHAYDRATTDAEIDAIHARCDALHEGVRHGR